MKVLLRKWWWLNSFLFFGIIDGFKAQVFQNLVPNGSFETFTQCPTNGSEIYSAVPWTGPTINSSDYFNPCSVVANAPYYYGTSNPGYYCYAKEGQSYAGIYVYNADDAR